jgi:poly-gamma-glutamate synthesis protein (capsule biosynthesis protein)
MIDAPPTLPDPQAFRRGPRPWPAALGLVLVWSGCGPFASWPAPHSYFPWIYTPQANLEPYETVRWETETWDPSDTEMVGLYVLKALHHRPGAPKEELEHYRMMRPTLPPLGPGARLSLAGDIMWIGGNWAEYTTATHGMLDGDLRLGNLETPTSPDHSYEERALGLYAMNAPPEMLNGLPMDLLQLNNNHSLDAGDLGLENTVAEVERRGLLHAGVDGQGSSELRGSSGDSWPIAVLAYTWGINDGRRSATGRELHIVPFGQLDGEVQLDLVERQIAEARSGGARSVVVLLHWGFEYEYYPDPHFMVLARRMIALGADLIVGQGPHVAQPPELCYVNRPEQVPGLGTCSLRTDDGRERVAAILYSLGNFGTTMPTLPARVGVVATVSLDPDVTGLAWEAVLSLDGPAGPALVPLWEQLDVPEHRAEYERLRAHLGGSWER